VEAWFRSQASRRQVRRGSRRRWRAGSCGGSAGHTGRCQ